MLRCETAIASAESEMTRDGDNLPPIDVKMGSNNKINHIGHKITYEAPPPPSNAVFQNGKVIGEFVGEPQQHGDRYMFPMLSIVRDWNRSQRVEIQGVRLHLVSAGIERWADIPGRGRSTSLEQVTFEVRA